jgi:hypothetical protein
MPHPPQLTDEALNRLDELAAPISDGERPRFREAVAHALAPCAQPGPGDVHRVAQVLQRNFAREVRHSVETSGTARHLKIRPQVRV